jgi:membrane-bound inhibitor of C-type lysozyme
MTWKLVPVAALAVLALSGCGSAAQKIPQALYSCDDGTQFSASFPGNAALVTLQDHQTVTLPQQRSGSGFWYSSGRYELRGKGKEATWTVGRRTPVHCRAIP